ncbi:patatin-like phospholipase family protein [Chloroflexota bacterium]
MAKRKIGLALGSGAARGLAHIGVLQVLEREGIPIDVIAGTSAGAAVGALYARGKDASQIAGLVADLNWKKIASLVDLALPKTGFIAGRKIKNLIASALGDIEFSDLKIPLACVATDMESGEEVVIEQGSVLAAIRASISLPVIFTVAKWQGRYLVDGGLVNPVPVSVVKKMGADFTIAVNVAPDIGEKEQRTHKGRAAREPNIIHVIMQSLHIATYSLVRASLEEADIIIEPQVAHIPAGDFHQAEECILQGEIAAQEAIMQIKRRLGGD